MKTKKGNRKTLRRRYTKKGGASIVDLKSKIHLVNGNVLTFQHKDGKPLNDYSFTINEQGEPFQVMMKNNSQPIKLVPELIGSNKVFKTSGDNPSSFKFNLEIIKEQIPRTKQTTGVAPQRAAPTGRTASPAIAAQRAIPSTTKGGQTAPTRKSSSELKKANKSNPQGSNSRPGVGTRTAPQSSNGMTQLSSATQKSKGKIPIDEMMEMINSPRGRAALTGMLKGSEVVAGKRMARAFGGDAGYKGMVETLKYGANEKEQKEIDGLLKNGNYSEVVNRASDRLKGMEEEKKTFANKISTVVEEVNSEGSKQGTTLPVAEFQTQEANKLNKSTTPAQSDQIEPVNAPEVGVAPPVDPVVPVRVSTEAPVQREEPDTEKEEGKPETEPEVVEPANQVAAAQANANEVGVAPPKEPEAVANANEDGILAETENLKTVNNQAGDGTEVAEETTTYQAEDATLAPEDNAEDGTEVAEPANEVEKPEPEPAVGAAGKRFKKKKPSTKRKKCPKGTKRNKKTGKCQKKKCPKGTRRNKKTGDCEKKSKKKKTRISPEIFKKITQRIKSRKGRKTTRSRQRPYHSQ